MIWSVLIASRIGILYVSLNCSIIFITTSVRPYRLLTIVGSKATDRIGTRTLSPIVCAEKIVAPAPDTLRVSMEIGIKTFWQKTIEQACSREIDGATSTTI